MKSRKISPSVLFLMTFTIGLFLSWKLPWHWTPYLEYIVIQFIGLVLLSISLLFNTLAYRKFKRYHTPHAPFMIPKVLIQNGVFSLSRHPVYLALVLSECGLAFVFDSVWFVFTAVLLWVLLDTVIVPAEEKILNSTFNQEYINYKRMTRRWL